MLKQSIYLVVAFFFVHMYHHHGYAYTHFVTFELQTNEDIIFASSAAPLFKIASNV